MAGGFVSNSWNFFKKKVFGREKTLTFVEETNAEVVSFVIDWTIRNFSLYKESPEDLFSETRTIGKSRWCLFLRPLKKADNEDGVSEKCISLYLYHDQLGMDDYNIRANIEIGIVDADGEFDPIFCEFSYQRSEMNSYGVRGLASYDDLWDSESTLLGNDKLRVRAKVKYMCFATRDQEVASDLAPKLNFGELHKTDTGRDFTLVSSDGLEVPAHRSVLIAHSPVFAAMFTSKMTECLKGRCVMDDVNGSVLKALVEYMYRGTLEGNTSAGTVADVAVAADKYQLSALGTLCERNLIGKMAVDNVADLLLLSDKIFAPALKNAALHFIWRNAKALKSSGALAQLSTIKRQSCTRCLHARLLSSLLTLCFLFVLNTNVLNYVHVE